MRAGAPPRARPDPRRRAGPRPDRPARAASRHERKGTPPATRAAGGLQDGLSAEPRFPFVGLPVSLSADGEMREGVEAHVQGQKLLEHGGKYVHLTFAR